MPVRTRLTRAAVVALVAALASYAVATLWWRFWLHHGWGGTPALLHAAVAVDGEASYDLTFTEMFVVSCCAFAPAAIYLGRAWVRRT